MRYIRMRILFCEEMKTMENKKKSNLRALCECALLVAVGFLLSFIKIWKMPLGGAVTAASMAPILLAGYRHGPKFGFLTSFVYAVLQILQDIGEIAGWGLTPAIFVGTLLLDYLLAYGILGLSGVFWKKKYAVLWGTPICLFGRFLMHFLSGVILFAETGQPGFTPLTWSLAYNGTYMLPELIITTVVLFALSKIPKLLPQQEG